MATLIDLIVSGGFLFIEWYSQEALSGANILAFFIKQLSFYLILQLVLWIFPFLTRFIYLICFPFRIVHVYLHLHAGWQVYEEIKQRKEDGEEVDDLIDYKSFRSSLITGLDRADENTTIVATFNRVDYARRVALAPNRLGLVMFAGYLLVAPLMFFTNSLTSTLGAIVHFYLFLAIFGVMMPSKNDWCFIFNTLLLSLKIRPIYINYSIVVYIVFTVDSFWRTADFFLAILAGMIMFLLYLGGLFAVAIIAQRGKLRDPQIFFVPYKTQKPTGVSFPEVEDFEDWEDL